MREKARIQRILSLLEAIWLQQPDVRFNQLISNLQHIYSNQNEGYGKRKVVEKWDSGDVETSYLDFFYLEDLEWEAFLESIVVKDKADKKTDEINVNNQTKTNKNETEDNAIEVTKLILADKTVDQIAEVLSISSKQVEKIKENLLEGTTLEQLQKQYASYERKLAEERNRHDSDILNVKFKTTSLHKECTHFFIEEEDEDRLSALNLSNYKMYPLHYDSEEDEYYVINEEETRCYSIDAVVQVKMMKWVD